MDRGDGGDGLEIDQNLFRPDITGMEDFIYPSEQLKHAWIELAMGIRQDTNLHVESDSFLSCSQRARSSFRTSSCSGSPARLVSS